MPSPFFLSPRLLTEPFWQAMLESGEERAVERQRLAELMTSLEGLRSQADYNTGSVSFSAAWCLYSVARYFQVRRALEVGTFIGRTTLAMASAMDDAGQPGEIATCDGSNALTLPWKGRTRIAQFQRAMSTTMLKALDGVYDFAVFDGRIAADDLPELQRVLAPNAVIVLDDFEGMEKGVANLSALRSTPWFPKHLLIYPPPAELLRRHGLSSPSLMAVLIPTSLVAYTRQG